MSKLIYILLLLLCMQNTKTNRVNKLGLRDGLWIEKYSNGKLKSEIYYKNGLYNGLCKYYYKNGNIQAIANYQDSIRNGDQYLYYINGIIQVHSNYSMGKCLFFKKYSESGYSSVEDYYLDNGKIKASVIIENGDTVMYKH